MGGRRSVESQDPSALMLVVFFMTRVIALPADVMHTP